MENETGRAIDKVLEGDIEAFARIVRLYQKDVWRIVAWAMRDVDATEDLVQQAFLNAFLHLKTYDRGQDFGVWLRTIARNLVRTEIRRMGREGRNLRHYYQWLQERLENHEETQRQDEEFRLALEECKKGLAGVTAKVLSMRYERAFGFSRIAVNIGRTVAATRQLLTRARLSLRKCVEERRATA